MKVFWEKKRVEASAGIEPAYTDLQSAASPLRQEATVWCGVAFLIFGAFSQALWFN